MRFGTYEKFSESTLCFNVESWLNFLEKLQVIELRIVNEKSRKWVMKNEDFSTITPNIYREVL